MSQNTIGGLISPRPERNKGKKVTVMPRCGSAFQGTIHSVNHAKGHAIINHNGTRKSVSFTTAATPGWS